MIQNPDKRAMFPTVSYEHAELEMAKAKLVRVELWLKNKGWESGSDRLYEILKERA